MISFPVFGFIDNEFKKHLVYCNNTITSHQIILHHYFFTPSMIQHTDKLCTIGRVKYDSELMIIGINLQNLDRLDFIDMTDKSMS